MPGDYRSWRHKDEGFCHPDHSLKATQNSLCRGDSRRRGGRLACSASSCSRSVLSVLSRQAQIPAVYRFLMH
jgi:hypothetical protein